MSNGDAGDWVDSNFSKIMKTFREVFRANITYMGGKYGLLFDKDIPEKY